MKVTIITACYNRGKTIRRAMESVMAQSYPDIEYIVVDGASTDESLGNIKYEEIVIKTSGFRQKHPNFCLRIVSEPDHGMYEAINKGIRMATGDVIALCHSDDRLYDEHTVEMVANEFEKHPEADMVYADGVFVNSEKGKAVRVWKSENMRRWRLKCGWLPLHTTCYIKKEVYERYGLYDESYKIAADTKFLLDVLYRQRIRTAFLPQFVVKMQMGGASTDMNRQKEMWKEDIRVFRELGFCFPVWMKMMKMLWKPSQFIRGKLMNMCDSIIILKNYGKKK